MEKLFGKGAGFGSGFSKLPLIKGGKCL